MDNFSNIIYKLIGNYNYIIDIFIILVILDISTLIIRDLKISRVKLKNIRNILVDKLSFFIIIVLSFQLDLLLSNKNPILRDLACIFYISVEITYIIENLKVIDIPLPNFLKIKSKGNKIDK